MTGHRDKQAKWLSQQGGWGSVRVDSFDRTSLFPYLYVYTYTFMCVQSLKLFPFSSLANIPPSPSPFIFLIFLYPIPVSPPSSLSLPLHAPSSPSPSPHPPSIHSLLHLLLSTKSTRSTVSWTLKMRTESPEVKIWPGACGQKGQGLFPFSPETLLSTFCMCFFTPSCEVLHACGHTNMHTHWHIFFQKG